MNRNQVSRIYLAAGAALLLAGCQQDVTSSVAPGAPSVRHSTSQAGRVTRRPIEEFIAAQGTYCLLPGACVPIWAPLPELVVWYDGASTKMAAIDYTGEADAFIRSATGGAISLGTTVDGSVTERVLNDGRAEIKIMLRTDNALTFVGAGDYTAGDPLLFGATPAQVVAGATPALGKSFLELTYITTAPGLPLSDVGQLAFAPEPGQEVLQVNFHVQADGVLHEGSGFPEGTIGRLNVHQLGIFKTKSPKKAQNPFVVEFIKLTASGR